MGPADSSRNDSKVNLRVVSETEVPYRRRQYVLGAAAILGLAVLPRRLAGVVLGAGVAWMAFKVSSRRRKLAAVATPASSNDESQVSNSLFIAAQPVAVYETARKLICLDESGGEFSAAVEQRTDALMTLQDGEQFRELNCHVTADQRGEFFAVRMEQRGKMVGNWLIGFDLAPGGVGTVVKVTCRSSGGDGSQKAIMLMLKHRANTYLANLKEQCEQPIS